MTDYPSGVYSPRIKNNKDGIVYDPLEDTTFFAEDVVNDDNEIVAIETELGTTPSGTYATVKAWLTALTNAVAEKCTGAEIDTGTDDAKFATPKAIADSDLARTGDIPSVPVKATGAEIDTGTDDAKFATAKAIEDSDLARTGDIPSVPVKAIGAEIIAGTDDAKFATAKAIEDSDLARTGDIPSVPVKATGAEIDTGTDDAKFATPKAIEDSDIAKTTDIPVKAIGAEITTGTDDDKFATAKAIEDSDLARTGDLPVLPVKATGAEINTGTDDAKFATPKAIEDSDIAKTSEIPVKATGAEIDTGTDDAKFVTAKAVEDSKLVASDETVTLSNKRITPRVGTVASDSTPNPAGDTTDMFTVTALAAGATFASPTGSPVNGQKLIFRIKDNGTARALAWNAIYRSLGGTLPDTTVISKTLYIGLIYNSADSKWDCVAVAQKK